MLYVRLIRCDKLSYARQANIMAARSVAGTLRTSLGPKGKLLHGKTLNAHARAALSRWPAMRILLLYVYLVQIKLFIWVRC